MKYKLSRDLPFAEAGKEIEIGGQPLKDEPVWVMRVTKRKPDDLVYIGTKNELIESGWIEEVKPREWWVIIGCHTGILTGFETEKLAVAYKYQYHKPEDLTIVKVREVIE